jgi:ATP-dependent helicase/nuclease subunit B
LRRIVLIAQDRLSARRIRALLEREAVLVSDESGWTLSTSRAAASLDALLETVESGAYHRDFVDLCKSPYVFADCDEEQRKAAVFAIETALRAASVKSGLARFRACLAEAEIDAAEKTLALALIDRVDTATGLLRARAAPLARWLDLLQQALSTLAATDALASDAAGRVVLELVEARRAELESANPPLFSFRSWRDWLNREFEAATFRDAGIASTIVLTSLKAVRLRRFEAALLIGGDAKTLAPDAGGTFFNTAVRRELGLATREDGERELRRDLELLLAGVPRVVVCWQAQREGEANLLAPDLARLSTLHRLAWNDDLHRPPLPARAPVAADAATAPTRSERAAPVAPAALLPRRVSVSAYASLVACPYRFFASYVLALGERDEVAEEMDKSAYGALVHRVLERFHARHALVSALSEETALAELQRCSDEVFAAAVADNFLATGWRLRWQKRLASYLDWQREREAQGWRWQRGEARFSRALALEGGEEIEFYGRIDRIDRNAEVSVALLDYKTQAARAIAERLRDDIQLPSYALLHGEAAEAAYVALDDEAVATVTSGADAASLRAQAEVQGERLRGIFAALHAGAALPAHGAAGVCKWCAMSGLCRKDHV